MRIFVLAVVAVGLMCIGIVNSDEKSAAAGSRPALTPSTVTRSSLPLEQEVATQKLMRDPWEKPDSKMAGLANH